MWQGTLPSSMSTPVESDEEISAAQARACLSQRARALSFARRIRIGDHRDKIPRHGTRFDQDVDSTILSLARELAELTDREQIIERLRGLAALLGSARESGAAENNALRNALAAGEFCLKGVLFDAATDTQGYVAVRRSQDGPGMAVLAFRGTQQVKDWMTNLDAATTQVCSSGGEVLGNVHLGFHEAFLSVYAQIGPLLDGDEDLPLFITGHSLGGALATLATWYLKGDSLAACYTFGAPRVGDTGLMDRFRTPIYRLVNGVDPVPFVPPSDKTVSFLKHALRFVGMVIGPAENLADGLVVRHVIIFGHGHGLQRAIIDESQHRTPERLIMAQH